MFASTTWVLTSLHVWETTAQLLFVWKKLVPDPNVLTLMIFRKLSLNVQSKRENILVILTNAQFKRKNLNSPLHRWTNIFPRIRGMLIAARNVKNGPIPPKLRIVVHSAHPSRHAASAHRCRGNVYIEHILFVRIITWEASINYHTPLTLTAVGEFFSLLRK